MRLSSDSRDCDPLLRLRPNLCLWGAPPPYSGKGRPKLHGDKFKLSDSSMVRTVAICGRPVVGSSQDSTMVGVFGQQLTRLQLLRIVVSGKKWNKRSPKPMWLGWLGGDMPVWSRHGDTTQVCSRPLESLRQAGCMDTPPLRVQPNPNVGVT